MSFVDYNFFPILFFLGWNILTTKQFRPNLSTTSESKALPALSIFSLTNSINQKTLQSRLKHQKKNDILEFLPEFRFLSENQKLINTPQINIICSENQPNDASMFKSTLSKHKISTVSRKEGFIINYIVKPTKWLKNGEKTHYFTNYNLINNNWKKNFKLNFFDFTYRSKRKTFLSFFSSNYKTKSGSFEIESSLNLAEFGLRNSDQFLIDNQFFNQTPEKERLIFVGPYFTSKTEDSNSSKIDKDLNRFFSTSVFLNKFLNANSFGLKKNDRFDNSIFLRGLCFSQSHVSFWKKIQKQLHYTWFFNKIASSQANSFLSLFGLKNQIKKVPIFKKHGFKHETCKKTRKNTTYDTYNSMSQSSFLWLEPDTNKLNNLNSIQKRRSKIRLLLRIPNQKIYSLNRFQIALCFSKIFQPPIFFNDSDRFNLTSSFSKNFQNENPFVFQTSINTKFPELYNSMLNSVKNELESQNIFSRTQFVNTPFVKPNQETGYVNNYRRRKKNWYMKTQFFQHIAWNMKHKISDRFSNLEYLFRTTALFIKNTNDIITKPSYKNEHHFFKELKKNFKDYTFCQNYLLRIYAGSWYYENLVFPYSIFNSIDKTPLLSSLQYESIVSRWHEIFFKQKNVTEKKKLLESKRVAIAWLYARRYNLLQNFGYWPYQNQLEYDKALLNKNKVQLENKLKWNSLTLSNHKLNNSDNYPDPFLAKSQTRFESDIGIYSLSHKLSSVGFRNGNSEINIYPFKYNDSYRYNFQNMNLSNQHFKNFLGLSSLKNQTREVSVFSKKNSGFEDNFTIDKRTHFSNFKKFLDFQNPIFSKIYAPVFQPQGLNLLSFITNSFLNVIPNSVLNAQSLAFFGSSRETEKIKNFFSPHQIQPIINNYPHYLKNSKKIHQSFNPLPNTSNNESFQTTPKRFKMLNSLYHKLPINGIHTNSYPWITQNAFDRWSASNSLWTLTNSSFLRFFSGNPQTISRDSKTEHDYPQANCLLKKKFVPTNNLNNSHKTLFFLTSLFLNEFKNTNGSILKTSINKEFPTLSQKPLLKNDNSQLHFTEKPSCIKRPSIFFSSFRHLPYFFISETPSTKNIVFPQANLSVFSLVDFFNFQLGKPIKNSYNDLSIPQYDLFNNHILKKNEKKQVLQTWKGFLQHKSFSLKPLSTFIKKEVGYQTSLFSWALQTSTKTNKKITKIWPNSKEKSIQKIDLVPIQKNTWKVFPPLFQSLTFRFIDLNLPRTWSSELLRSMSRVMPLNRNTSKFSNIVQNTPINGSSSTNIPLLNLQKENAAVFSKPSFNLLKRDQKSIENTGALTKFLKNKLFGSHSSALFGFKQQAESGILPKNKKWNITQKNFFRFSIPFYFSDFFRFPINENNQFDTKYKFNHLNKEKKNIEFYESALPLINANVVRADEFQQPWNNHQKFEKRNRGLVLNETPKFQNSKILVYGEKPLLKNRTAHGPPLKNQKESISLPSYLKNITNQNYQNLCPNNLNELYFVFWILFNKTLFIYLSLHYLGKFISFLGTEYIRNLFKIFVTMKFIDGNILSIIKTFQDFNFQLNQQNIIDIKVNKQLKEIKRN